MRIASALVIIVALGSPTSSMAQEEAALSAAEAGDHVGQTATVCGKVESARYATRTRGQPTFLNFGRPYPNQVFTALIWGSDRAKFPSPPDSMYSGRKVCVRGVIRSYRGRPEVILRRPEAIWMQAGERD